jgi:serine/threonine-protein kinase
VPSWQGSAPATLDRAAEPAPAAPLTLPEVVASLRPVARSVLLSDLAPLDPPPASYEEAMLPHRESRPTQPAALTKPAPLAESAEGAGTPSRQHRLPQLGGFQLGHEIGRGAMGRVYQAQVVESGEAVAVKTLALAREFEGFALQEARIRFQREALAALRLRHPDIVQVIDAGEDQGYAWIAMELLPGHDLVRYTLSHNLLPVPEVLEICARVAGALSHAHAQGVVHRDIKPANVMYLPETGAVKVTDFGIARITDAARTRTGLVLGSPSYMSPEHLAGGMVDGRSDLYSLGVVLFQLLTGVLPVQGHSMADLMRAVAQTPAPDVRSLRPRLPEAVANIVSLALEKRVELRYADAREMETDLRLVRGLWERRGAPPGAPPPERSHRTVQEVAPPAPPPTRPAGLAEPLVHNQSG